MGNFTLLLKCFKGPIPCYGKELIAVVFTIVFAALSARPVSTLLLTHVKYNEHFSRTRTLSDWESHDRPFFCFRLLFENL